MLTRLRRKQFIEKKIKYLTDRVKENPILQTILDEYMLLYQQYQ